MTSPFAKEATKSIARWVVAAWLFVQLHVLQYKLKAFLSNELGQKHFLILAQEQPDKKDMINSKFIAEKNYERLDKLAWELILIPFFSTQDSSFECK